jgi:hypothetical protein
VSAAPGMFRNLTDMVLFSALAGGVSFGLAALVMVCFPGTRELGATVGLLGVILAGPPVVWYAMNNPDRME